MKNIKAIIFDMDGILVDTEPFNQFNLYRFLKTIDSTISFDSLNPVIGSTYPDSWMWIISTFGIERDYDDLRNEFLNSDFNSKILDYSKYQFPYIQDIFELCIKYNIKIAIASASKRSTIEKVINDNNWNDYVECYVSGFDVDKNKPHPDVYQAALKELTLKSSEVIAIEDSEHGIKAAKAADLFTLSRSDFRFKIDNSFSDIKFNCIFEIFVYLSDKLYQSSL